MKWHASEEHDTLGVELTEVSSHSTPSLRHGVAWCARRHTSIRFVEGSGLSPVRNIPDDEKLRERRQETAFTHTEYLEYKRIQSEKFDSEQY